MKRALYPAIGGKDQHRAAVEVAEGLGTEADQVARDGDARGHGGFIDQGDIGPGWVEDQVEADAASPTSVGSGVAGNWFEAGAWGELPADVELAGRGTWVVIELVLDAPAIPAVVEDASDQT